MLRATQITCRTDTGRQRRDNEDSAFARDPLFVVADGMGGAQAGEVASRMAIETFEGDLPEGTSIEQRLAELVREANRRIHERARVEREHAGMGTTLTAAYLEDAGVAIAHVGDSRAYLWRDGTLKRLTRDHSLVDELVQRGKLTEQQAAEHPQRSIITRALGPEPDVEVDTWTYPVRPGDVLLLCSDGLTSMISEDDVAEILGGAPSLAQAGEELVGAANQAGGRDNITVVLFGVEEAGAEGDGAVTGELPVVEAPTEPATPPAAPAVAPAAVSGAPAAASRGPVADRRPRRRRFAKPAALLMTLLIIVAILGAGGYLASRQLFFIGTNPQGVVVIYRGLPYDLPAGIHLYETFYVSGYPASLVPADRRATLFDNRLRSQTDAVNLVRQLELGRISQ
ncbi:MAG TPA: Stp1/IreP family PP2C-type Ser/Thr phosphatase [Solirubrobacteraceae bacterium]|nr:Stp1/IreP family PP2C-type Ser/Thr phosphatase [Solirubrobacteraceae bacterium]